MTLSISTKTKDILSYEPDIWSSADILRMSVGLKYSENPDFMMPFFALMMVESRLVREYVRTAQDPELLTEEDIVNDIKDRVGFYNSIIIENKKTLADIVKNDKTFYSDFIEYLNSFDLGLKTLLGIVNPDKTENLYLMSVVDSLRKKNALFQYVTKWAVIDFTPYDNSEITTLEEHIKRKWADMSAETAGEQYTPDDIINLISELVAGSDIPLNKSVRLYDMTCGGGNMLFGVEDKIKVKANGNIIRTETYGQELRGSLYALAKIESMFRRDSYIENGNTLTADKFSDKLFDFGIANPPYGVDWKEEKKTIEDDQTERFGHGGYPSVSDGQLLFVQHMLAKLNNTGKAFIVLNGSPLFSGDAGGGESGIRKWILDNDYLEALIQLPTNEFFNTGITTYIWCLNKNKASDRKNKITCINAENKFVKLKKNKGNKSREIPTQLAKEITNVYLNAIENDYSKVLSKYDFYYNKQNIKKIEKDDSEKSVTQQTLDFSDITSIEINDTNTNKKYTLENNNLGQADIKLNNVDVSNQDNDVINDINDIIKSNSEGLTIKIFHNHYGNYLIKNNNVYLSNNLESNKPLGLGKVVAKILYAKNKKLTGSLTGYNCAILDKLTIEPIWTKDIEKISYSPILEDNKKLISSFLNKWVSKKESDYQLLENTVGVEINFNNIFPQKIEIRTAIDILKDLDAINKQLGSI